MKVGPWFWFPALLLALQAQAGQTIWRCGEDGRVFSDRPCSNGQALPVHRTPTAGEAQAAEQVAVRERQLADTLRQERHARARVAPGSGLIAIGPSRADLQAQLRMLPKPHKPRASGPDKLKSSPRKDAQPRADRPRGDGAGRPGRPDRAERPDRARRPPPAPKVRPPP